MNVMISSNDSFAARLISGSRASLLLWNKLPLPEASIDLVWQGILAAKVFVTHKRKLGFSSMMLLNNSAASLLSGYTTQKPEKKTPGKLHGFSSKDLSKP